VEVEKPTLAFREATYIHNFLRFDAHAMERRLMCYRGNDELAGVLKTDETSIEQVIDARGQQQPVLSVQALLIL
jgi:hypothetical protein